MSWNKSSIWQKNYQTGINFKIECEVEKIESIESTALI